MLHFKEGFIMENREVKMVSMGLMFATLLLQKDYITQTRVNVFVKEIMAKRRDKTIINTYDNLAKGFYDLLKAGPDKFTKHVYGELSKVNSIDSFIALRNECPILSYVLITEVQMIARFSDCQSVNNRIYNAYVSAVQSLDGLI